MHIKLVCFLGLTFWGCTKMTNQIQENNSAFTGRWILTETLADPGNGSGKWIAVSETDFYFLQLNSDSTAKSNYYSGYYGNTNLKAYSITNDSTIIFTFMDGSIRSFYCYFDGSSLKIMGGCIEACGTKFRKE